MTSKLLQPIQVGNLTFKNRIMFPPLTTGYEERDGSIGPRSLAFYTDLPRWLFLYRYWGCGTGSYGKSNTKAI